MSEAKWSALPISGRHEGRTMLRIVKDFLTSESGSTTADWIVLTAGVVGLGIGGVSLTRLGVNSLGDDIAASLRNAVVAGDDSTLAGPTIFAVLRGMGTIQRGACDASGVCAPDISHVTMLYMMSDGSTWSRTRRQVFGEPATETWRDSNGNVQSAPEFSPPGTPSPLPPGVAIH
ncbi:MAG: hypothetical protein R3D60_06210 [Paracoccaceae bacterium]